MDCLSVSNYHWLPFLNLQNIKWNIINKICVNQEWTWFHFTSFLWNVKSVNDTFHPLFYFEGKTCRFQCDFTWNCWNYANQTKMGFHNIEPKRNMIPWNAENDFFSVKNQLESMTLDRELWITQLHFLFPFFFLQIILAARHIFKLQSNMIRYGKTISSTSCLQMSLCHHTAAQNLINPNYR